MKNPSSHWSPRRHAISTGIHLHTRGLTSTSGNTTANTQVSVQGVTEMFRKSISMGMLALVSVLVLSACAGATNPTATPQKAVATVVKSAPTATLVATTATIPAPRPTVKPLQTVSPTPAPAVAVQNIISVTLASGKFKTLVAALNAAGLIDVLRNPGPFTVFAPTDDAFAKLPKGTLDDLLKPANKQKLTDILNNHIVSGKYMVADLAKLKTIKTAHGDSIGISVTGSLVSINGAKIVMADISSSNGVIQAIDTVLLPSTK
jgi:uncharacterized surface protein with fasciclin (FAS1) repeats